MTKPLRNAPCLCGSGLKYKYCCLKGGPSPMDEMRMALAQHIEQNGFQSEADIKAFIERWNASSRVRGVPDFQGLVPDQMHKLLYALFESPELVDFAFADSEPSQSPILRIFLLLAEGIGNKGIKPTATGNLPRNLSREIALKFWGEEKYAEETRIGNINTELDFAELHKIRVIGEGTKLIRKYKGRFILSREARDLIARADWPTLYRYLFSYMVMRFNWAYEDRYYGLDRVQQLFGFVLFLLARYGGTPRPGDFYEDAIMAAFPMLLEMVEQDSYRSEERQVRSCLYIRIFDRALPFLGLAEVVETGHDERYRTIYTVERTALFERLVRFKV